MPAGKAEEQHGKDDEREGEFEVVHGAAPARCHQAAIKPFQID
jgi:hypothetical protein